jgi:MFS family permease
MALRRSSKEDQGGALTKELVFSLYLPAVMLSLGTGIVAPNLPIFARSFDISFGAAAMVLTVHAWGGIASALPTGYLLDRLGRRPVMLMGPFLTAMTAFSTAFAPSFAWLLVLRFINGFAAQMWVQGRLAMIADTGRAKDRGKLITWLAGTQRFGMLFAPVIGGVVGEWDIKAPFILHGILVLIVLVPLFKLIKESAPTRSEDGQAIELVSWREVKAEMLKPQILFFLAAQFFANLTRGSVAGILLIYVAFTYDKGPGTLGLMQAGQAAIIFPTTMITGVLMDRYGRKKTVVPGFIGMAIVACLMAATSYTGTTFGLFLLLYYALGASQGLTSGNMQVLGADLAPERMRGRFFSFQRLANEFGGVVSPTAFSILSAISYAAAFGWVGVCGVTVALIIAFKVEDVVAKEKARLAELPPSEPLAGTAATTTASAEP